MVALIMAAHTPITLTSISCRDRKFCIFALLLKRGKTIDTPLQRRDHTASLWDENNINPVVETRHGTSLQIWQL